jgi:phosphate transport system substrate-binding protein
MTTKQASACALLAACAVVVAGCGGGSSSNNNTTGGVAGTQATKTSSVLVGAGSTLVAPLVSQWSGDYAKKESVTLTYGAIGSGGGVSQITNKTVDFGASDAPLQGDQKQPNLVQIPWALAATVVAVNLPGVSSHPKLTGAQLADIYLGKLTYWDQVSSGLPHLRIAPVYRSDSSGDTFVFTSFLTKASPAWKSKVGTGTEVSWPTGTGAKGNAGMTAAVQQTKGAIAYIGIAQVKSAGLNYALVRNPAGQYPEPSTATIAQAGSTATFAADHSASIVNAAKGYPLSTFTYVIVDRSAGKLATLKPFLRYAVGAGQSFASALSFAPLPANVKQADLKIISGL